MDAIRMDVLEEGQILNFKFTHVHQKIHTKMMWILASRILCCGNNRQILMDYRNPVEKKGRHGHSLSERGCEGQRELTPAWTGFYCFSGHIT